MRINYAFAEMGCFIAKILFLSPFFTAPDNGWPPPSTTILSHFAGRIAPKWYEVSHALGVGTEADALLQSEHGAERKCLQCLKAWVDGGPDMDCSWKKLFRVLHSLHLYPVAKDIFDFLQEMATTNHSI